MRRSFWKRLHILSAIVLMLTLCGCAGVSSVDELYTLPKLPAEYTALESQIDALLSGGSEYAAPLSGSNIQSVQMVDLDGDKTAEAVAFMRNTGDEKNLKIHIFREEGDSYVPAALIEGSGSAIYSIYYADMNGDGWREILVGWRLSADVQALSVCSVKDFSPTDLLVTTYAKYNVSDFDGDGFLELVVFRSDEEMCAADCYRWTDESPTLISTENLSVSMAELNRGRVTPGVLETGESALFVTGVSGESEAVTDILALRGGGLYNIAPGTAAGVSSLIFPYQGLFAVDMDGDGVTEVPQPRPFQTDENAEVQSCIHWCAYDAEGKSHQKKLTYHNSTDGWFLTLPEDWDGRITVRRSSAGEEATVIFSVRDVESGTLSDFLAIYTFTGPSREYKAARGERFILGRQLEAVHAAEFLKGNADFDYAMDETELRGAFSFILTEWTTGDN
ncbi:MAG: VCBS repeat-containing protein [Oscillospiraceae bacterium]|nr:VCBS repeat-containing protein [Oscillospiraceae bacterium]